MRGSGPGRRRGSESLPAMNARGAQPIGQQPVPRDDARDAQREEKHSLTRTAFASIRQTENARMDLFRAPNSKATGDMILLIRQRRAAARLASTASAEGMQRMLSTHGAELWGEDANTIAEALVSLLAISPRE